MMEEYPFILEPLSEEDGGGFFITFPDLPGCFADGDTIDEAIASARDAFEAWMTAQTERAAYVPTPHEAKTEAKAAIEEMRETIAFQVDEIEQLRAELKALKVKTQTVSRWQSMRHKGKPVEVNPLLYAAC